MAADFNLSFDANRAYLEIVNAIEDELSMIGDRFVDIAKREVTLTTYKGAPGREDWRKNMAANIKKFPFRVENGVLILPVGLEVNEGTSEWIRALVITFGSGYKAQTLGGIKTSIEPHPGEEVWDSEMSGRKTSEATGAEYIPDEFNQEGNMWLDNTMRQIQPELDDLQKRVPDIVADIVRRNIR